MSDPDHGDMLPFDNQADYDAKGRKSRRRSKGGFAYIGDGLTADEFTQYVATYNFGSQPPDFVVLHHTAVPCTLYTPLGENIPWDANENGLSTAQIKAKRKGKLDSIRKFYQDNFPTWGAGPHLFIDDRFIWLFTPMYQVGVHAAWGNDVGPKHYSIGIEVVGYYEKKTWPEPIENLVRHAVTTLMNRLKTFKLEYMYPTNKPGRKIVGYDNNKQPIYACEFPERLKWGGIASHRDYSELPRPQGAWLLPSPIATSVSLVLRHLQKRLASPASHWRGDEPLHSGC